MGVVKNLMVRIGADASGVVKGMKSASSATGQARDSIQRSTTSIKKTMADSFGGAGNSVRQYAQTVRSTRQVHREAQQNAQLLGDRVEQLKGVYTTVKAATAGLDLSKPLSEQMVDAEKALTQIEHKRKQIEGQIAGGVRAKRTAALQAELEQLAQKSRTAEARLANLDRIAEAVGRENMGHASAAGLEKLQQQITATKNQLITAQGTADATGKKLGSMGSVASYAVGRGVGKLWQALKGVGRVTVSGVRAGISGIASAARVALPAVQKLTSGLLSLAGRALRGIAAVPGKLLQIGKNATRGAGGVGNMVRQIRNIGVVSLGLRVAGGMFGRLRSIISNYISSNEELSAATSLLTYQLGQSLEPAIRLVIVAMQELMPIVTKISAGVSGVLQSIIGEVGEVRYAYRKLGTYGFDQITKADSEEQSSGQTQEQSALVTKLTGWIQQLKGAFTSGNWTGLGKLLGEGINSAFESLARLDIGPKIQSFCRNLSMTLRSAMETVDWATIGQGLAGGVDGLFEALNSLQLGTLLGMFANSVTEGLHSMVAGIDFAGAGKTVAQQLNDAIATTDWSKIGQTIGMAIGGLGTSVATLLKNIDWAQIGQAVKDLLQGIADGLELSGVGEAIGLKFRQTLEKVNTAIGSYNWSGSAGALAGKFNDVVAGVDWAGLGQSFSTCLSGALSYVNTLLFETDWLKLGQSVKTWIVNVNWSELASKLCESIGGIFGGLAAFCWGLIGDAWKSVVSWWREAAYQDGQLTMSGLLEGIGKALANVGAWIKNNILKPFINGFKKAFGIASHSKEMQTQGGYVIDGLFGGIKEKFASIKTWVKTNLWEPFKKAFADSFAGLGETFAGIFEKLPDKTKQPINAIISFINSMISGVCGGINTMVKALNALSFDIPGWVPVIGGKTFGLNLKEVTAPQIPMLAEGGVVDGPTKLIAGEKGKEAIVPLERNTGWIDKVADKITARTAGGGSGQPMVVQIYLGKRKLTEYVIEDINQITRATGVCPIRV